MNVTSRIFCYGDTCRDSFYFYEAIEIHVTKTSNYTILSSSTLGLYGYLYNKTYNPSFPDENLLLSSLADVDVGQFGLTLILEANNSYILVVTSAVENSIGAYLLTAVGLGRVSFSSANISGKLK